MISGASRYSEFRLYLLSTTAQTDRTRPGGGKMRTRICLVILSAIVLTAQTRLQAHEVIVPAGTILQCTLSEPKLSSQTAEREDPILCDAGPLHEFGVSVFPRGAYLAG